MIFLQPQRPFIYVGSLNLTPYIIRSQDVNVMNQKGRFFELSELPFHHEQGLYLLLKMANLLHPHYRELIIASDIGVSRLYSSSRYKAPDKSGRITLKFRDGVYIDLYKASPFFEWGVKMPHER